MAKSTRVSIAVLKQRYAAMPENERLAVDGLLEGREINSEWDRRRMFADAMNVVRRQLESQLPEFDGLTKEERLAII